MGEFAVYSLTTPIDTAQFKSVQIKFMYRSAALFYVYPLDAAALGYENAVQSFRTNGAAGIQEVTLSTEQLADTASAGSSFGGFIIQVADGASDQLFVDSITPSAAGYTPGAVEEVGGEEAFEWEVGTKYDITKELLTGDLAQSFNPAGNTDWGLCGDGVVNTASALAEGDRFTVEFSTPIPEETANSIQIEFMYNNRPALFYVYPLGTETLSAEMAAQSFRPEVTSVTTVSLSLTKLVREGEVGGFIVQLVEGSSAQFFLESVTLSGEVVDAEVEVVAEPEKVADVTVSSVQVVWHGENSNWIYIYLDGAAFTQPSEAVASSQFSYFTSHISVNGTLLSDMAGGVYAANKGFYADQTRFMIELLAGRDYSLRNDGTDVIEIEQGCRFPVTGANAIDYYEVSEGASFRSVSDAPHALDANPETFVRETDWTLGQTYDISTDLLLGNDGLTIGSGHEEWGLTGGDAYTQGLAEGDCVTFRFVTPIDAALAKSMLLEVKYDAAALFYVYPLGTEVFDSSTAAQSFRTTAASDIEKVALSLEKLAEGGTIGGFVLQIVEGEIRQFFLDSVTLSEDPVETEVELPFAWEAKEYDATAEVFMDTPAQSGVFGGYDSLAVTTQDFSGAQYEGWGIEGYAAFTGSALEQGQFMVFRFTTPVDASQFKSLSVEYVYNANALFYVYPYSASGLGYENAVQSFRTDGSALTLSLTALAEGGEVEGFLVQLAAGSGAQFFLDGITLSAAEHTAEKEEAPTAEKVGGVTVAAVEVRWGDGSNRITFDLDGANFTNLNEASTENWEYFLSYITVNGTPLSEMKAEVLSVTKRFYDGGTSFMIALSATGAHALKNDGTDVIAVQAGCRIPVSGWELAGSTDYYEVTEDAEYRSVSDGGYPQGETPENFVQQIEWEAKEYDATAEIFMDTPAQTDVLGGYDSLAVTTQDFSGAQYEGWGIEGYAAFTGSALEQGQFMVFRFTTPVDASQFKSLSVEYVYNANALFYVYPYSASGLGYENAVQSFRTDGSALTLSLTALAEGGEVEGFLVQLAAGSGAQFFLDGITLSAAEHTAEKEEAPTAEKVGGVTVAAVEVRWGDGSNRITFDLDGANFTNLNEASTENWEYFLSYITVNGTPLSEMKAEVLSVTKRFYDGGTSFMIALSATGAHALKNDGTDVIAVQAGCRIPVSGWELAGSTDYYEVTEDAEYRSVSDGGYPQGETPENFVQQIEWEAKEYDATAEIFMDTPAQTDVLGGYDSQRVLPTDFSDHADWGLSGHAAYTVQALQGEQFAVFKLTTPVEPSAFRSLTIRYKYDANALFYAIPLDAEGLGYDAAVQSFRTTGENGSVILSAEALAGKNGTFGGFILWVADGDSAQFFLDSITLHTAAYDPGEVEIVIPFAWEIGTEFDANGDVFVPTAAAEAGGYSSLPVVVRDVSKFGITAAAAFCETQLAQGQFLQFRFAEPVTDANVQSFTLKVMHNASACFYVYPLGTEQFGMEHAVQSFRTENGIVTIELSATELFRNGACEGFIVQLMTETGLQFFLDSITLSDKPVEASVEDLTEPDYTTSTVSIREVTYTYRYEGGYDDLLLITFDRNIFTAANDRIGVDDFADYLLINGVSIAESGIGDYSLRAIWMRYDRLGIFIANNRTGSVNNDAFDVITFKQGFAIRGSEGDCTKYTLAADAVFYTNRALDEGSQVELSSQFDPRVDQVLVPHAVDFTVSGGMANLSVAFDKTVRSDAADLTDSVLCYIVVGDTRLSEIAGVTVSYESGSVIVFTFAWDGAADASVKLEAGLNVQTNPDEPLTEKTVREDAVFVRSSAGGYYAEGGELSAYWISAPEFVAAEEEGGTDYVTFTIRLSVQNAPMDAYDPAMLAYILIGDTPLSEILAADAGSSAAMEAFALAVRIPASYIAEGLVITVKAGFAVPAGGVLAEDETFVYDAVFEEFVGEVHREEVEDLLTPTDINTIIRATDGVAAGTNQLFIEFTTPCSFKYLPFAQAGADTVLASYGSVGVPMTARYAYELSRYGMRESLWDYLCLDGKSVREWAIEDGGKDASRLIDLYYQGTNFGVYYLQIVIAEDSSAVMDWSESHIVTFKAGFVTPAFGVFEKDVQWRWDPQTQAWAPDASANATVDPDAQLKAEEGELLVTVGNQDATGLIVGLCAGGAVVVVIAVVVAVLVKKRRAKAGGSDKNGSAGEQ